MLSIIWLGFIFYNSLQTGTVSSEMSGGISSTISELLEQLNITMEESVVSVIIRKIAHFVEYFVLGGLVTFTGVTLKGDRLRVMGYVLFALLASGVADEYIQTFVEGRAGMVSDVVLDFTGALTAFLIVLISCPNKKRKRTKW